MNSVCDFIEEEYSDCDIRTWELILDDFFEEYLIESYENDQNIN